MYYLGKWVSLETDADIGIDDDGVTNIDPLNDVANRDGADDGLMLPVSYAVLRDDNSRLLRHDDQRIRPASLM